MGHDLERLLRPRSVAVIGASSRPGKIGNELLRLLTMNGYRGRIYPVNPRGGEAYGLTFHREIESLPENIDLALIALPGEKAVEALESLARRGLGGAVIYASGFAEQGRAGLEERIRAVVERYGTRVVGPNCAGFINWGARLYAGFVPGVEPGEMALISQSGAFSAAVNHYLRSKGLGLGLLMTLGNKADIGEWELLQHLGDSHPVYMLYIEGLGRDEGRRLASAVRRIGRPVVIMKTGWTEASQRALASHTASLAGDYSLFRTVMRGVGAYIVDDYVALVDVAEAVYRLAPPGSRDIAVVTNGGGPAAVLMDHLGRLGHLAGPTPREVVDRLSFLKPHMQRGNPIDLTADGGPDHYYHTVRTLMEAGWPGVVAVLHVPPSFVDPVEVARAVGEAYRDSGEAKPLVPLFLGPRFDEAWRVLGSYGLPRMLSHSTAAQAIDYLVARGLRGGRPSQ